MGELFFTIFLGIFDSTRINNSTMLWKWSCLWDCKCWMIACNCCESVVLICERIWLHSWSILFKQSLRRPSMTLSS